MTSPRVLLVGNTNYVHVRRWATALVGSGIDLMVLSSQGPDLPNVAVTSAAPPPWRPWRPARWESRARRIFHKVVADWKPEIVHAHFPGPYSVFPEAIENLPLIVSPWGADMLPYGNESPEDKARKVATIQRGDRIIALSQHLASLIESYAGVARSRIEVQYWGVDLARFTARESSPTGALIGFAKGLSEQYGADTLIDAMPKVLQEIPEAQLMILGAGHLEDALKDRASSLGIQDAIDWRGQVPEDQLPDYFSRMSISVMPSVLHSETLGVAALESQAMGIPVVATRVGGIPEAVLDGQTGLLVPPRDADALAEAMIKLLKNPELRSELGRAGREHVAKQFDWDQTVANMVRTYEDVVSKG